MKNIHKIGLGILLAIVLFTGVWWLNHGYGEVSPQTYQYSKALYSACLNKNELHLNKVQEMLANEAVPLPGNEQRWIAVIIAEASQGNWDVAGKKAKQMMEDQVQY